MISDHIPDRVIMKGIKRLHYETELRVMSDLGLDQEQWLIQWQRELRRHADDGTIAVQKDSLAKLDKCEGFAFLKDRVGSIKRDLNRHDVIITE